MKIDEIPGQIKGFHNISTAAYIKKGNAEHNRRIKLLLLTEQKNFCAYTEKYVQELDATELEHFNSSIKFADDYFNYYTAQREANLYKKDKTHTHASFFSSLFFQDDKEFNSRIRYIRGGIYAEVAENDVEARELIDFLGFNHKYLYDQRKRHVNRLKKSFEDASFDEDQQLDYFREHKEELNFITALEVELGLDLSEFY